MADKKISLFKKAVFDVVKKIPEGAALTYKQVALLAGRPKAFRAVGTILKSNYDPAIPCHRVIRSDGTTGQYNRGANKKILKLQMEGFLKIK